MDITEKQPLISVIIPVYNQEAFLPTCLDSVLAQTYRNLEVIVINDCSTDGSLDVLKSYAEKDARIVLIDSPENQGTCVSRNKGLDAAKGSYIGFVDDDDTIDPYMYEALLSAILKTGAPVAACGCIGVYPDGRTAFTCGTKPCVEVLDQREAMHALHDEATARHINTTQWNKLYTRAAIGSIRVDPDCGGSEDYWFIHEVLLNVDRIVRIPGTYYIVHLSEGSISRSALSPRSIQALEAHRRVIESLKTTYPELLSPVLVRYLLAICDASLRLVGSKRISYSEARKTIRWHYRYVRSEIMRLKDPKLKKVLWQHWPDIYLPRFHNEISAVYRTLFRRRLQKKEDAAWNKAG